MNYNLKWFVFFVVILALAISNLVVGLEYREYFELNLVVSGLNFGGLVSVVLGFLLERKEFRKDYAEV